jgi:shikimate kinase
MSIGQVFDQSGERPFRNAETDMLKRVARVKHATVVATGGGAIERSVNRRIMFGSGVVVYLRCSVREISRRLRQLNDRPMLPRGKRRAPTIKSLLARRKPLYSMANVTVSTSNRTVTVVVNRIVKHVSECKHAN